VPQELLRGKDVGIVEVQKKILYFASGLNRFVVVEVQPGLSL
jgi:hypothetical protein